MNGIVFVNFRYCYYYFFIYLFIFIFFFAGVDGGVFMSATFGTRYVFGYAAINSARFPLFVSCRFVNSTYQSASTLSHDCYHSMMWS